MDAFIQPSLLQEGLPLALAEAASAGLPLIATPIGGNPEIVGDGINGFIVPAGDPVALAEKIRYLMENSREVARMGENSEKVWLEKFNLTRMLNEIDSLYKTLKR
jgi:glycosyltransferase involved in cell wall biosynthesis